jgi:hypothetical protein
MFHIEVSESRHVPVEVKGFDCAVKILNFVSEAEALCQKIGTLLYMDVQ